MYLLPNYLCIEIKLWLDRWLYLAEYKWDEGNRVGREYNIIAQGCIIALKVGVWNPVLFCFLLFFL